MKFGEWKIWNAGADTIDCPVSSGTLVQVQLKDMSRVEAEYGNNWVGPACEWDWRACGEASIIAYREVIVPVKTTQTGLYHAFTTLAGMPLILGNDYSLTINRPNFLVTFDLEGGKIVGFTGKPF